MCGVGFEHESEWTTDLQTGVQTRKALYIMSTIQTIPVATIYFV